MLNKKADLINIVTKHGLDDEIHLVEGVINHKVFWVEEKKYVGVVGQETGTKGRQQGKLKGFFLKGSSSTAAHMVMRTALLGLSTNA